MTSYGVGFAGGGGHRLTARGLLRSVPKWENLGGAAGRTVKLALVYLSGTTFAPVCSTILWQAGEWQAAEGYSSVGRRAKVTVVREDKNCRGCWFHITKTCVLGHPEWKSQSLKVVAQTPPPWIGPQEFTDADSKIWMPMGMGCNSALGRSRRYVNRLSWLSLVYQHTNLKNISAYLARWV